jgi:GT2 family glycosyltransferase
MKIDVSVILVLYKSEDAIEACLDSINKSKGKLNVEVLVVDNYPLDRSLSIAKKHPLNPKTYPQKENIGLSKAVNLALKEAKGKYVFLLNPDTRLVGKCLEKLVSFANTKESLGAVAPKLLNNNGKIQPSVFKFPSILNAIKYYFFGRKNYFNKYYPGNKIVKVDIAVMAAFLIPMSVIKKVGGLDERFFLYYEDVEYCRRLHRYGLPVYFYPFASVKHTHGASGSFKSHLSSPLARSAQIYHGILGSAMLNFVLMIGQKWQKTLGKK